LRLVFKEFRHYLTKIDYGKKWNLIIIETILGPELIMGKILGTASDICEKKIFV
jgi:hypothetical protein